MLRVRLLGLLVVAALGLAACGDKQKEVTFGKTEGTVLDVGGLKYQVQISRQLNAASVEDRDYLVGVPRSAGPNQDELWFAVFIRVKNESSKPHRAADQFTIVDTRGNAYQPVPVGAGNVYAYRGGVVPGDGIIPAPNSTASDSTIQGSLLLYTLPYTALDNRPLELHISEPGASPAAAIVDLDV
jgi:hypothetical protein